MTVRYFGGLCFDLQENRCAASYIKTTNETIQELAWVTWKTFTTKQLLDNLSRCPVALRCSKIGFDTYTVDGRLEQNLITVPNVTPVYMTHRSTTQTLRFVNKGMMSKKITLDDDGKVKEQYNMIPGKKVQDKLIVFKNPKYFTYHAMAFVMACHVGVTYKN